MLQIDPDLDSWLPNPSIRVSHRRSSAASVDELWTAAQTVRLRDTQLLGRLVRWRIPGTSGELRFDELFRRPPFLVLHEDARVLLAGVVGRIWTLRRDYPELAGPEDFANWSSRGTARVLFATWAAGPEGGRAELCAEVRAEAFGGQGRVGMTSVKPLVRAFHSLIGSDGIAAAVRLAEGR